KLQAQGASSARGSIDDAVLAALAVAHDDDLADEVDVLDAQVHAFQQAHAGAVEQAAELAGDAIAQRASKACTSTCLSTTGMRFAATGRPSSRSQGMSSRAPRGRERAARSAPGDAWPPRPGARGRA